MQKQPEVLAKALADRHSELDVNEFLSLDARRRALLAEVEALKSRRNTASGQVAALKREGQDAGPLLAELGGLSDRIKELDGQTAQAKADVEAWLMRVPNIPDASVPVGRDETENVEVARWGTPRAFDFPAREHGDLGTALGLTVLRGVELGAAEDRHMHILGLHLGPECPALTALCRKLRASREDRKSVV